MFSDVEVCCQLGIMVKPPVGGLVKTRLARAIGEELAARLAGAFLEDTLAMTESLGWAETTLSTTDPDAPFFQNLPGRFRVFQQGRGDLGARIARTLEQGLGLAPLSMVLAADSPGLPVSHLEQARVALESCDAVLGPARDGGFYLLGLRRFEFGLLEGLPWSSARTCEAVWRRLEERGYKVGMLDSWFDVDEPEDLLRLVRNLREGTLRCPATCLALGISVPAPMEFACFPASLGW
jgi:rSAM/selenodomain-associated transferase 1